MIFLLNAATPLQLCVPNFDAQAQSRYRSRLRRAGHRGSFGTAPAISRMASMPEQTYRVIQWATGKVGQVAIRHFAASPAFELVGVLVTNPAKVGKDAGEIAGIAPTGVLATDSVEAIVALNADCVHYA